MAKDSLPYGTVRRAWLVMGEKTNYQGSYALNGYFYTESPFGDSKNFFISKSDIVYPTKTPFFVDALWLDAWPLPTDRPATTVLDGEKFPGGGLAKIAIPRHSFAQSATVRQLDAQSALPGAVNVTFADTHVEKVKLEKLWELYWHKNWAPPDKRPGLPVASAH